MPSKTIEDFAKQVKSYALGIKDQQVLGAWNFVENTATTETRNGVTFTVNPVGYPKGTIKLNSSGAPTGGIDFVVNTGFKVPKNTYYLKQNDYPSTGINSRISVYKKGGGEIAYDGNFDHEHRKFTLSEDTELIYRIFANKDGTIGALDDVIIYPMISLEDDTPYVPYTMTNRELTNRIGFIHGIDITGKQLTESEGVYKVFVDLNSQLPANACIIGCGWDLAAGSGTSSAITFICGNRGIWLWSPLNVSVATGVVRKIYVCYVIE